MQTPSASRWPSSAIVVAVVLGLIVLMLGAWSVFAAVRMSQVREQLDSVRADLDQAEETIAELQVDLAAARASGGTEDNLLDGEGDLGLEDLLGQLLGGEGEGLGGLEDLLGGLLGGESGDLGDLGGLFGDLDLSEGLGSCLTGAPASYEIADSSLEAQVDDIAAAVAELRGLSSPSEVEPLFVTPDEMARRVRVLVEESYPPGIEDSETRMLVALGMLPPGYDLMAAQMDLLDTGVAGYYDPKTGELVVATRDRDQPLGAIDQVILAHEMIHALTDATLGIPGAIEDPEGDPEIVRAGHALIEGDATLGMQQFSLGALELEDQLGMMFDPRLLGAQQEAGEFPYVLSNGLQLPYLEGMSFTCALYSDGGWEAVDAAYDDPPTNTAQILFPERYLIDRIEPIEPEPLGVPGGGWESLRQVGFGAVDLLMLFSAPGDDGEAALSEPRERARAWGGGRAEVWSRGGETAVGISLVDTGEGSSDLCASMTTWELAAFPDHEVLSPTGGGELEHAGQDRAAVVVCDDSSVIIGIGPDLETARSLTGPS